MNKKYLYLQIEIFSRDFQSRFLESLYAVSQDFEVILAPLHIIFKLAHDDKIPPGIIHTKDANCTEEYIDNFNKLKSKKFIITSNDEESGCLQKNYEDFYNFRLSKKSFSYIDKFFCWGSRDYNFLKNIIKIPENKIELSGSSRIDVWRSGVSQININSGVYKKFQNKIILISSNIGSVLSIRSLGERVNAIYDANTIESDEVMMNRVFETQTYNTLMLHEFIKLIQYLTKELPDYLIVLRPHPIEKSEDWINLLNIKSNNFLIGDSYNLIDWINISNLIINNGCTASIEGYFANKNIINFNPSVPYRSKIRDEDVDLATKIGTILETKEEIIYYIHSNNLIHYQNDLKKISDNSAEINLRFFNDESENYKIYIKIWEKLIEKNILITNKKISENSLKKTYYSLKNIKKYIKKLLIYFIPSFKKLFDINKHPFYHKFPEFNLNEIIKYKFLLCQKFNIDENIKIKKIDTHIIKVFK